MTETQAKPKKLQVTCQLSARSASAQGSLYTPNIHTCFLAHPLSVPQLSNTRAAFPPPPPLGKEEGTKELNPKRSMYSWELDLSGLRTGAGERTVHSHVHGLLAGTLAPEQRRIAEPREV